MIGKAKGPGGSFFLGLEKSNGKKKAAMQRETRTPSQVSIVGLSSSLVADKIYNGKLPFGRLCSTLNKRLLKLLKFFK